jgi:tryptophan 2,3-dioxygenase
MSYGDYLHLDAVLSAQHPLSPDHDEMLFIVQHQTSELWMKLMLHELRAAVAAIGERPACPAAFKMLARVSKIMEQLVHAWDVLATMTPPEYSAIRPYLSQLQRLPELAVPLHRIHDARQQERRHAAPARAQPDNGWPRWKPRGARRRCTTSRCACWRGAAWPCRPATRSVTGRGPTPSSDAVEQAWLVVYRDARAHWDLYQLGEELTDLEDAFRLWRFRHLTTVERVIGIKRGTGGTSGVGYLRKMLDVVLFPEIWKCAPRSSCCARPATASPGC